MLQKIAKKYNMNVTSMLRNGTVAVITLFGVGILFGNKNIMLAFPIALTSTVIGRQNFYVNPIMKISKILVLDIAIVLVAFLSSLNLWVGIFINFIAIFLIMYTAISQYDPTFYKPFVMLYVFTQYAAIPGSELPKRILSVVFGAIVIILGTYIARVNSKVILGNSVKSSLNIIMNQLDNIKKGEFKESLTKKCTGIMMELVYKVYVARDKKYLTTNLGAIQFKLYLNIEYLNIHIKDIYNEYKNGKISNADIDELQDIIVLIIKYCDEAKNIEKIIRETNDFNKKYSLNNSCLNNIAVVAKSIVESIEQSEKLDDKQCNKIYSKWERSDIDSEKAILKEYFTRDSIRFKFAMRMAITLTFAIFIAELLGYYKVIWAIITIMSIMQPYYEDTIKNSKDRVKGNIIAILFVAVVVNMIDIKWFTVIVLILSLYLLYGFKEYYKISLFAATASICVSSLDNNVQGILIYRIIYLLIGVVIVLIANKFICPYKLEDGIGHLLKKIIRLDKELVDNSEIFVKFEEKIEEVRALVMNITLLTKKLSLRNTQYGNDEVNTFIQKNNEFTVNVGNRVLVGYEGRKNEQEEIINYINNEYGELSDSISFLSSDL